MQLDELLGDGWIEDANGIKPLVVSMYTFLAGLHGVELDYKARPGVSYSLRAKHVNQKQRPLFVLIDVIDDDPSARWLSVCFFADMVNDAEEVGDVVPGGLFGEDARCFDIESLEEETERFLLDRLAEACSAAA